MSTGAERMKRHRKNRTEKGDREIIVWLDREGQQIVERGMKERGKTRNEVVAEALDSYRRFLNTLN